MLWPLHCIAYNPPSPLLSTHELWYKVNSWESCKKAKTTCRGLCHCPTIECSRADHTGQFWHHPSASPAVRVRKVVGHHLFLNITPNNFTARTEQKVWCDRGIKVHTYSVELCDTFLPYLKCVQRHYKAYVMGSRALFVKGLVYDVACENC